VSLRSRPAAGEGRGCGGLRDGWVLRDTAGPGEARSERCGAVTRPGSPGMWHTGPARGEDTNSAHRLTIEATIELWSRLLRVLPAGLRRQARHRAGLPRWPTTDRDGLRKRHGSG